MEGCYQLRPEGLDALRGMPLTSLNLLRCPSLATDAVLDGLRGFHLTSLSLSTWCMWHYGDQVYVLKTGSVQATDAGLAALSQMPLTELVLRQFAKIEGVGLAHLQGAPLKSLDLFGCSQ